MRRLCADRLWLLVALVAVIWTVGATSSVAEIGAIIDPETDETATTPVYMVFGIGDDPEPIGWVRYRPDSPSRKVLNDGGHANGDGPPSAVFNPASGTPVVVWARNSPQGFDVVISHLADGEWTEPEALADSALDELDPHVVLDPANGDVHVFYWVDDLTPRVMHRQAPADLSSWSAAVTVSDPADVACRPAGAFHDGSLYVSYEVHDWGFGQTPRQVVLARRVAGGAYEPEIVAITHNEDVVRPEVHSNGGILWVDWIDTANELAWTQRDGSGQWSPVSTEPYAGLEARDFRVRPGLRSKVLGN